MSEEERRELDPLELELQVVPSHPAWVLGTGLMSSRRVTHVTCLLGRLASPSFVLLDKVLSLCGSHKWVYILRAPSSVFLSMECLLKQPTGSHVSHGEALTEGGKFSLYPSLTVKQRERGEEPINMQANLSQWPRSHPPPECI